MKRTLVTLALLAVSLPLAAQRQQAEPPEPPRLVENIDVRVINVDVVVTDRKGNFIPGLTKDDFEILENNSPKAITNFYEVEGDRAKNIDVQGTAPTEPAGPPAEIAENLKRRIVFYVDNLSLSPFNRNRVFDQMKEFLKVAMRPGDEAMVATYNRSMKVRVPFTRDIAQIESMLDTLKRESGLGIAARSERRSIEERIRDAQTYEEAVSTARTYAASVEHDLRQAVNSVNALMSTLAGVDGKKVLVMTSEGFPIQPGREAFYFIDDVARDKGWAGVGTSMLEAMVYESSDLIQSVARTANANGITLYTVHAAGLGAGMEMSAENDTPVSAMVTQAAISNTTESMQLMADMTGGLASVQTNNFAEAFRKIKRDLDSYYSLGYRAGTERVDRQRYLRVRVKGRNDVIVRNRQTFVEKSIFAEMSDRVVANLLYRVKDNDLGILARIGQPLPAQEGLFRVPVDIQIPLENLTLIPQGDVELAGGFDVYVVVADERNDMSEVARQTHQIRVPAADAKRIAGKFYTYSVELLMEKGLNRISIGVVDQVSNVSGFSREQIIARDLR